MKNLTKVTIIAAALGVVGIAQATDVNVGAIIPAYCQINLANGSSGTASIGMEGTQTIAQLDMSCNTSGGASLTLEALNGDFVNASNSSILVNYAVSLDADINDFDIAEQDMSPGNKTVTNTLASYSPVLADGIGLTLSLNMNVDAPGPTPLGQTYFAATSAPAGAYNESFSFTVTSL